MANIHIGVIINGATGRMGTTQHMAHLLAIAKEGGLKLKNGDRLIPELTAGRPQRRQHQGAGGGARHQARDHEPRRGAGRARTRSSWIARPPAAGPSACARRSPPASTSISRSRPRRRSRRRWSWRGSPHKAGLKHGVIQDKLFLPGFAKLLFVKNSGFFGRILSVRIDAGSWIFDGTTQECQRPSWNYRKKRRRRAGARYDGALALHDRPPGGADHRRLRADDHRDPRARRRAGQRYKVDAEDTVYAMLKMQDGAIGLITNSWATRPRRDDTMMVHIDGTDGSAVGRPLPLLHPGGGQHAGSLHQGGAAGRRRPAGALGRGARHDRHEAAFRQCWETFLRHVGEDAPFVPTLVEGAKAVQLADLAYRASPSSAGSTCPS